MTTTKAKPKKASKVKQAAWAAVLDAAVIASNLTLIAKEQMIFTAEDYLAPLPLPIMIPMITLILLVIICILTISQTKNAEKDDELSKLNRYKAGYLSQYIFIAIIIILIWNIQDFRFAFTEDPVDNFLRIPIIFVMLAQFIENITFIILEKRGLE
ncbi:MAG: hypothetical protein IJ324_00845 [Lachnospiraceae bacterium]|nr:hypothetical protein [Lachnospiraceae bacterium]